MRNMNKEINPGGTILNRTVQNLAFADDVDLVARSEKSLVASFKEMESGAKELGLNVNEEKTKYMISRTKADTGKYITIEDYSFERVPQFKYLGSIITEDNNTSVEIKARIAAANKSYYALLPLLSASAVSRNLKLKLYKIVIRPVVMYGSESWRLTKADENCLSIWERKILRKVFGAVCEEGNWRIRTNQEIYELFKDPDIVKEIKVKRLQWLGHLRRMEDTRAAKKSFITAPDGKRSRGRPKKRWIDDVEEDIKKWGIKNYKQKTQNRDEWREVLRQVKALHEL